MKSFLVIGLGRFGRHLTRSLIDLGNEVMVVDQDEELVARMANIATAACVGDCQDEQVLESLGVRNFDVCFVCVKNDFQSSLEATATLKELGAKCVVARADQEKQIKFLKKSARILSFIPKWIWQYGRQCASRPGTPSITLN